jgi:hypothetical protein
MIKRAWYTLAFRFDKPCRMNSAQVFFSDTEGREDDCHCITGSVTLFFARAMAVPVLHDSEPTCDCSLDERSRMCVLDEVDEASTPGRTPIISFSLSINPRFHRPDVLRLYPLPPPAVAPKGHIGCLNPMNRKLDKKCKLTDVQGIA